jgi:hypothetical protein
MAYNYAKITVSKSGDPKVNKQTIIVNQSKGKGKYHQICWNIKATRDDIFVIYIDGDLFDEKRGPRNSYSARINKNGTGEIKTKLLKSNTPHGNYKYIIVRVFGAYRRNVKALDPRISVQG